MKKTLLLLFVILIVGCGNRRVHQATTTQSVETETIDSTADSVKEEIDTDGLLDSMTFKPLNEIRFGNWTDKDWYDNDYFRFLRKFIDACYKGEAECDAFEPYKHALNSKFAVAQAMPSYYGGMFILFNFLDIPNIMFEVWIYSSVDRDTETVIDYEIRGDVSIHSDDSMITKEYILSAIEEHPENKSW